MEVESFFDQVFFTTVRLECRADTKRWVGTGFVYAVETQKGSAHFLVTNKHVVQGALEVTARMVQGEGVKPKLGHATQTTIAGFGPHYWSGHPDPDIDVAVVPFWEVLESMQQRGAPPFFKSIPESICLTAESAAELDSVVEVAFVGYPSGIFDTVNFLPIARRGTTATPIVVDYQGLPAFLVDASVFPGSSGSPVFLIESGISFRRGGGFQLGTVRQLFLGVMAAVHVRKVEGQVIELQTATAVVIDEPIDLGIVFKASTLAPCIDPILRRAGLHRVDEDVTEPASATEADATLAADSSTSGPHDRGLGPRTT